MKNNSFDGVWRGLKIIIATALPYKKDLFILSAWAGVLAMIGGVIPFIWGRFIDALIAPGTLFLGGFAMQKFLFYLAIWLVAQAFLVILGYLLNIKRDKVALYIYTEEIKNGFHKLIEMPMAFFKKHESGKILNRLSKAANHMEGIFRNVMINILPQFITVVIALIISFMINWLLASIMVVGLGIFAVFAFNQTKTNVRTQTKAEKYENVVYGDSWDVISNIQEVKHATTEKYEQEKIQAKFSGQLYGLWLQAYLIWDQMEFVQKSVVFISQVTVLGISILFIQNGSLTVGEFITFNAYAALLLGPFATLADYWHMTQRGIVAINQTQKIFNNPSEKYRPEGGAILKNIAGRIEFKNVDFYYDKKKPVLTDISFTVEPGQTIALVGESGVGKSTLIGLLSGYYFPKKGRILVDGHDIKTVDLHSLRSGIAVVSQEVVLFNDTIKNNIRYSRPEAGMEEIVRAAEEADAWEFITGFPRKWKQQVGERGVKLSVGQKQRVAIARAVLRDPKILILDEPTSALDAKTEQNISGALDRLMKGRTTFIIAHRLSTVRNADKIIVLKDGKIAETGKHLDLLKKKKGVYKELYSYQIGLRE